MTKSLTCTRCKKIKPDDSFRMCEKCRHLMRGQYHRLRRDDEIALYDWMRELKASMFCHDCGASFPQDPKKLVWDHRPGEMKIDNISDMIRKRYSQEEILAETKKCDLVCPACHAKRGVARGQIWSGLQGSTQCQYCQKTFKHRRGAKRRFCSRKCSAASRRKLKLHYWKPSKPLRQPKPKWWEGQTIYDMRGNVVY